MDGAGLLPGRGRRIDRAVADARRAIWFDPSVRRFPFLFFTINSIGFFFFSLSFFNERVTKKRKTTGHDALREAVQKLGGTLPQSADRPVKNEN